MSAAIEGERNLALSEIARDDCCQFGKWLHKIELSYENQTQVRGIKTLPASFTKKPP